MTLDSDAAFALKVHIVEHLRLKIFTRHSVSVFQKSVG